MKPSRYAAAALAVLAIGTGIFLSFERTGPPVPVPQVGYTLLDGVRSDTAALRGRVVLINFWATSCAACVQEMPRIIETHRKYRDRGFDTLAVAMSYDAPANVVHFARTRELPFPVAIDLSGEVARAFGDVRATPTSLLLNRRGEIVRRYVGAPDFVALQRTVEQLLAES